MGRFTAIGRDREVYGNRSRWGICRDREIALQKRGWFLSNKRSRSGDRSTEEGLGIKKSRDREIALQKAVGFYQIRGRDGEIAPTVSWGGVCCD